MFSMTRYSIESKCLRPWVKFIWHFEMEKASIYQKLLPTDCIDIILNLSNSMIYETASRRIIAPSFHINGLRSEHSYIHQIGAVNVFGISFYSYGLRPFLNNSLSGIQDEIVDLHTISASLTQKLIAAVSCHTGQDMIKYIENALCSELCVDGDYTRKASLINEYIETDDDITLHYFCIEKGINIKTFERMVLHCTGYTPKTLRRIKRFQTTSNQLIHQKSVNLTGIAYDNSFTDQSHFIKEFRKFSGVPPRTFQKEKITVKENTEYIYI